MTQWSNAPTRLRALPANASPEEVANYLADVANVAVQTAKDVQFILNGNVDFQNIRAKSIKTENLAAGAVTAEKITVDELSAISANLGHIIAGLIESVQIFGSYIATANGAFPRCEMSIEEQLFAAYTDAANFIKIIANGTNDKPEIQFQSGDVVTGAISAPDDMRIEGLFGLQLTGGAGAVVISTESLDGIKFDAWSEINSIDDGESLKDALDAKISKPSTTFTGSFATATQTITVVDGIITSVV